MSQFCFDTAEAAKAAGGSSPRTRIYRVDRTVEDQTVTKFVPGASQEIALSRFAAEVLGLQAVPDKKQKMARERGPAVPKVTKKHLDQLVEQATNAASPEEAQKILTEVKSLRQQLEESKAAKKAAKDAVTTAQAPATPPGPPSPPSNVPAPPAP